MSQWTDTDNLQWGDSDFTQWGVEYVFEATKYNLVGKEVKYYLEAKNKDLYFVAEDLDHNLTNKN